MARYFAEHESKFGWIGGSPVYNVRDLLKTSQSVTIYTVTSDLDEQLKKDFETLCSDLGMNDTGRGQGNQDGDKWLRLCIVSSIAEPVADIQRISQGEIN